jgi:hypothetical protein
MTADTLPPYTRSAARRSRAFVSGLTDTENVSVLPRLFSLAM